MSLIDGIAEALANANPPPPNESTTCEWIIVPLLHAAGYSRTDLVSRWADNNGQFPDYTILADTPNTWFLEAKAWKSPLEHHHALQSLNYANQNGKRWVVLTNGRIWRLYDNYVQADAAQKLVSEVDLRNGPGAERFLTALGKASVLHDGVLQFATEMRLRAALARAAASGRAQRPGEGRAHRAET